MEDLYPLILSYSYVGNIVIVRCDDEEQADNAFREMFSCCGHDVVYSVD